jgi:hypothetical protein
MVYRYISLLLLLLNYSFAWGPQGHEIIATYAELTGDNTVIDKYTTIIGGSFASVSNWADEIKDTYEWSSVLHYIDTPDNACTYIRERDCVNEQCVTGAIRNYTSQIPSIEAIKFVIHFVGDVHQPLHVGFTTDRGGNTIKVEWYSHSHNLHYVWDTGIITHRLLDFNNSINLYTQYLINNITIKDNNTNYDDWATESIKLACNNAYNIESKNLGDEYYNKNLPVVEHRLALAGYRLKNLFYTFGYKLYK